MYGFLLASIADAADSLGVIDKLIYRDHKITWDQLIEAVNANWEGHENLRQLCVNGVPKYGNDDDYADDWAIWIANVWADLIDWLNTRKDLTPKLGRQISGRRIGGSSQYPVWRIDWRYTQRA